MIELLTAVYCIVAVLFAVMYVAKYKEEKPTLTGSIVADYAGLMVASALWLPILIVAICTAVYRTYKQKKGV